MDQRQNLSARSENIPSRSSSRSSDNLDFNEVNFSLATGAAQTVQDEIPVVPPSAKQESMGSGVDISKVMNTNNGKGNEKTPTTTNNEIEGEIQQQVFCNLAVSCLLLIYLSIEFEIPQMSEIS
jgi:hypothetical protein